MATEEDVKKLRTLGAACVEMPIDSLVTNPEWGKINFDKARSTLERMFGMLVPLSVLPLQLLPQNIVETAIGQLTPVAETISQIRNFNIEGSDNPAGRRDQLSEQLKQQLDALYPHLTPHIPYLVYARGDVEENISNLTQSVSQAKGLIDAAKADIAAKRKEIDDIVIATREASAKAGVATFTGDFSDEALALEQAAGNWLKATSILAVVTVVSAAAMSLLLAVVTLAPMQLLQALLGKIIILAVLFTATIWCGRLYKASKHQATTNRHRANALKTFQAFTKAASDDAARNAVLMETTRSIFAHAPSGFLDSKDTSGDGHLKIVEVVKNVTQTVSAAT